MTQWPKRVVPRSKEEQARFDDWQHVWLKQYNGTPALARFNHGYVLGRSRGLKGPALEVGAGRGEHLALERAQGFPLDQYHVVEQLPSMAKVLRAAYKQSKVRVADCQKRMPYRAKSFERVIAIHVLEHLPNLPGFLREAHRLLRRPQGRLLVVIPCEGGWGYQVARTFTSKRQFEKRYGVPYEPMIRSDHVNTAQEVIDELGRLFVVEHRQWFPAWLPSVHLNLCLGLTLAPKD